MQRIKIDSPAWLHCRGCLCGRRGFRGRLLKCGFLCCELLSPPRTLVFWLETWHKQSSKCRQLFDWSNVFHFFFLKKSIYDSRCAHVLESTGQTVVHSCTTHIHMWFFFFLRYFHCVDRLELNALPVDLSEALWRLCSEKLPGSARRSLRCLFGSSWSWEEAADFSHERLVWHDCWIRRILASVAKEDPATGLSEHAGESWYLLLY